MSDILILKPLSPAEAQEHKVTTFPLEVIAAVNNLIKSKWSGKGAFILKQNEVINEIMHVFKLRQQPIKRDDIFTRHLLDFEDVFREVGWKIEYDKPGYNEDYEAFFRFTPT